MKLRNKKTGEIREAVETSIWIDGEATHKYISLAELNEDWEDYTPVEPKIKDKKIRKAVRAWAEANNITVIRHRMNMRWISNEEETSLISFDNEEIAHLVYTHYTITELCGGEE